MSTELFTIHSANPQKRMMSLIANKIKDGAVITFPTESGYSIGTALENKKGVEKIRKLRKLSKRHDFTLLIDSFANIGEFAKLDNNAFRLMKRVTPGPYTFILEATKQVPNRLVHPKKKTIGIRLSPNIFIQNLLLELSEPLMSVSLIVDNFEFYSGHDVFNLLKNQVDIVIDSGNCPSKPTTVLDFTKNPYELIREGAGDTSAIF
jgi:tRNA threonylcarbamoyl adenosine modification protein (Sua5/YciO/YrdC/YwlC family)